MLNRRYLRIKVYQALYAYWQGDGSNAARIEQELHLSIQRTFDLYLALLLVFGEVHRAAERRIEERRNKRLPTAEDLSPNLRFVQNPVLQALMDERLDTASEKRKVNWVGEQEIVTKILRQFEASEEFQRYMALPEPTFKDHQEVVLHLFVEHIANFDQLQEFFEARSIHWLEDLDLACSMVKRTIEGVREGGKASLTDLFRGPDEEREFVSTLYRRTIDQGAEHEQAIAEKASNWESDRIALSDMILMKMALTEARVFSEVPVKVTLNEYIEIAKAYSTPKSRSFINGILDKLFAEMKEDGRIRKVGRGLLEN
ncbi:MAG TPA: transcription antitermination protein NusB [Flavobacteriales bacterium]|nr:transcription antitermination protein NusB [Flavobacteriales bacterium]HPQ57665.1 transcription antitermination protein NusB [Flavobacteriales bacterium]